MALKPATVHASAVLAGPRAILIRGPAGAGKSRLALALVQAADCGLIGFARLVGDDRIELAAAHGRLLAHEPVAVVGLVVDLAVPEAERLPGSADRETTISGIILPRLALGPALDPLPAVLAWLLTAGAKV
jgi:HPr kinase/phosphorylase